VLCKTFFLSGGTAFLLDIRRPAPLDPLLKEHFASAVGLFARFPTPNHQKTYLSGIV